MSSRNAPKDFQRSQTVMPRAPYHFHCLTFLFVQRLHIASHEMYVGVPPFAPFLLWPWRINVNY